MKRLALVAAVLVIAACSTKETPKADTAAPAMAPAPAMTDTGMKMDSAAAKMDTAAKKADTAAAAKDAAKAEEAVIFGSSGVERGVALSSAAPRFRLPCSPCARHQRNASGTPSSGRTGGSHPSSRRARSDVKGLSREMKSSDARAHRAEATAEQQRCDDAKGAERGTRHHVRHRHGTHAHAESPRCRAGRTAPP